MRDEVLPVPKLSPRSCFFAKATCSASVFGWSGALRTTISMGERVKSDTGMKSFTGS
jgi:hypothetical protein